MQTKIPETTAWRIIAILSVAFSDSNGAWLAAYLTGLLVVGALAYAAWRKSERLGQPVPASVSSALPLSC